MNSFLGEKKMLHVSEKHITVKIAVILDLYGNYLGTIRSPRSIASALEVVPQRLLFPPWRTCIQHTKLLQSLGGLVCACLPSVQPAFSLASIQVIPTQAEFTHFHNSPASCLHAYPGQVRGKPYSNPSMHRHSIHRQWGFQGIANQGRCPGYHFKGGASCHCKGMHALVAAYSRVTHPVHLCVQCLSAEGRH